LLVHKGSPIDAVSQLLASENTTMQMLRNIFACLVHESRECIIDLVRNLKALDPTSAILLYNGSADPGLLNQGLPLARYDAQLHPSPRPLSWGRLHEFAIDCMEFALETDVFDIITIVDSDQLCARPGYSNHMSHFLDAKSRVGVIGKSPAVQTAHNAVGPAIAAHQEIQLWRPLLQRFPDGGRKFAHWTFWPSTVFTADAARDLVTDSVTIRNCGKPLLRPGSGPRRKSSFQLWSDFLAMNTCRTRAAMIMFGTARRALY
jgi:hypothetical protein